MRCYVIRGDDNLAIGAVFVYVKPRSVLNKVTAMGLEYPDIDSSERWHIGGSAILEGHRKKGLWTEAMKMLETEARKEGVRYLTTDMGKSNKAIIRARESLGFTLNNDPFAEEEGYLPGTKLFGIKVLE